MKCIQFDENSKFGSAIIPGDPHEMSYNGKILFDILSCQNMIIVNATEKCTVHGVEQSFIDFFVICFDLFQKIVKMTVDESRHYV